MSESEAKQVLYSWLGKKKVVPQYEIRQVGRPPNIRFLCELSVDGYHYRAVGNSTNKKDAQTNAAKDFLQFLIRTQAMQSDEVPSSALAFTPSSAPSEPRPLMNFQARPVFEGGMGPRDMGRAFQPAGGKFRNFEEDAKKVAEAEDLDVNAQIHGNWTIENAKSRLHQYLQMNKIPSEYKYSAIGPDHSRNFQAELSFYVKELGRPVHARETGSNKQSASKSCALSLVRQLYHLGVVEAFTGSIRLAKNTNEIPPFPTSISPEAMSQVRELLHDLNIVPPSTEQQQYSQGRNNAEQPQNEGENSEETENNVVPLLEDTKKGISMKYEGDDHGGKGGIVSWSPPVPNWNPWTACNIDEGHMATTSLEQLSEEFMESFKEVQQTSQTYREMSISRNKLPITSQKHNIMDSVSEFPVVLIKGDTGCGKTTQICQFILDDYILSGQGANCNIVVTQPRRISAISVAERVAHERSEDLGQTVGYSVRFESVLPRPYASVLFCTVGVLLRKLEAGIRGVSHIIVDEVHERSCDTDFLLVVLRDMLSVYPDLRVILMSATFDDNLFTQYFNSCPVITVEGRAFPVETYFLEDVVEMLHFEQSPESIRERKKKKKDDGDEEVAVGPGGTVDDTNYNILPPGSSYSPSTINTMKQMSERDIDFELLAGLLRYIRDLDVPGSVLVFLPGWNNIFTIMRYLSEHPIFGGAGYCILPLHSQLPREDQHRVFDPVPPHITKIILSTNIAETSITIDDVVFVIDSCKAKSKLFTSHNNMTTFVQSWGAKSNLYQRRGRAGRVRDGYCYHLCSRRRFEALEENMVPEMFRTPLHEIALAIKLLRLGGVGHFLSKAPEPPPIDAVIEAEVLLTELKCLDVNKDLTPLGKILAKLPLDPRLGKMIVLASIFSCGDSLAIISAQSSNLSEIFNLGVEMKRLSGPQRGFGANRHSDHFAVLNAFQQWSYQKDRRGEQAEIEFCQQRMLSLPALRMTGEAKNQLLQVLNSCGFPEEVLLPNAFKFYEDCPLLDVIAGLLLVGFYPNVCYHRDKRKVLTTESKSALIHKASINCTKFEIKFPFPFFVFGEKIRTRAVSCKQMTMISPIHMLLFGAKKVDVIYKGNAAFVRLDNWVMLKINPEDAAAVIALRPAIEDLITRATENPECFFPINEADDRLVQVVSKLCRLSCVQSTDDEVNDPSSWGRKQTEQYGRYKNQFPSDNLTGGNGSGNEGNINFSSNNYNSFESGKQEDGDEYYDNEGNDGADYDGTDGEPNEYSGSNKRAAEDYGDEDGGPPAKRPFNSGGPRGGGFSGRGEGGSGFGRGGASRGDGNFGGSSWGRGGGDFGGSRGRGGGDFGGSRGRGGGDFGGTSRGRGSGDFGTPRGRGSGNFGMSRGRGSFGSFQGGGGRDGNSSIPGSFTPRGGSRGGNSGSSGFPRFSNNRGWGSRGFSGGRGAGGGRGFTPRGGTGYRPRGNYPY